MYLDLKSDGAIAAPWPMAKCPTNAFVIFQPKFTKKEIARLRRYVASAEYQGLQGRHTNYYLAWPPDREQWLIDQLTQLPQLPIGLTDCGGL